jgi:tRNA A37 N6-isopentenylltransferase MiaA
MIPDGVMRATMPPVNVPVLVVVTGMPAAGKTTLAHNLSRRLSLPLIERDRIKVRFYETLGTGDVKWSEAGRRSLRASVRLRTASACSWTERDCGGQLFSR